MSQDQKPRDRAEEEKPQLPPKPPGYRKFEKLLKQVVKAPPLKRPPIKAACIATASEN
jgi:hypothetical protein